MTPNTLLTPIPQEFVASVNLAGATNDADLAQMWLLTKSTRSLHTHLAYKKELNRFFSWMSAHRLNMHRITAAHAQKYLLDLSQQTKISASTVNYARGVLTQLFAYACDSAYLTGNAFKLTAPAVIDHTKKRDTRDNHLSMDAWQWLKNWVQTQETHSDASVQIKNREIWLLLLLYHTGLRREEVAKAKLKDIQKDKQTQIWQLKIRGKGNKLRLITLNTSLIEALNTYLNSIHKTLQDDIPLLPPIRGNMSRHVTPRYIGMMIQNIRDRACVSCPAEFLDDLNIMTTHWMRHTHATHRLSAGADLETTQSELGHADINTTRIYAADTLKRRVEAAEKLAQYEKESENGIHQS